jgi:hypothetical protein
MGVARNVALEVLRVGIPFKGIDGPFASGRTWYVFEQ